MVLTLARELPGLSFVIQNLRADWVLKTSLHEVKPFFFVEKFASSLFMKKGSLWVAWYSHYVLKNNSLHQVNFLANWTRSCKKV